MMWIKKRGRMKQLLNKDELLLIEFKYPRHEISLESLIQLNYVRN
jgi:hypothetical protein